MDSAQVDRFSRIFWQKYWNAYGTEVCRAESSIISLQSLTCNCLQRIKNRPLFSESSELHQKSQLPRQLIKKY